MKKGVEEDRQDEVDGWTSSVAVTD
jgi:hypothetical protein